MEVDIPLSYLHDLSAAYFQWVKEIRGSKVLELSYSSNYVPWEEYGISAPEELRKSSLLTRSSTKPSKFRERPSLNCKNH
jgi:hypothetical protein